MEQSCIFEKEMMVMKRDEKLETVSFDKILRRIKQQGIRENGSQLQLNYTHLAMKVIDQLYDGISTTKIDELSAEQCASLASTHPDYNVLAGRILVSNHQKNTSASFSDAMNALYAFIDKSGNTSPLVSHELYEVVKNNTTFFDELCDYSRDYLIDYFGFKTLERSYLIKINGKTIERPQHMWLRVSIGIHGSNLEKVEETYHLMSQKYFTHATPTLFNAGTLHPQLSSCFLIAMEEDSIDGIYNTLKDCALISKYAGGIGLHIHNIRASGSHIRGTNGTSNGIVPMLRVFNNTAKYVDQGGGKRNGSFAIYLEPWHADIEVFLQMRKNHGDEELKARDLFYALWIPDLFMKRVKENKPWSLMCPDECPGLADVYGDEFEKLYESYESRGMYKSTMLARDLWFKVMDAQMETGTPYLCYKDAANKKSNQKNLGTIKSSNLCVAPETTILTDKGHVEIQTLKDQVVNVWNGHEFSEVTVKKTGEDQELIKIYTDDGLTLECTPYHKFYIQDKETQQVVMKDALNLIQEDILIRYELPMIDGKDEYLFENNKYEELKNIPSGNCPIKIKLDWFQKLCNKYESFRTTENIYLDILEHNNNYLIKIKLMLQTCGIYSKISILDEKPTSLVISIKNSIDIKIIKIENENRISDTYCFTEPKRNMGIFNGIITGQCSEIIEYSDANETAVCNLASVGLPTFVTSTGEFDYDKLHGVCKTITYNLNRVIDINYYPTEKTRRSNMRHRPIGIGVQGLADVFILMGVPFHSDEAKQINRNIFETIYHAALEESCDLAISNGPYETFMGSPASEGILQFDLWGHDPGTERYDWPTLKSRIQTHGIRNSLLLAPMPTASTSQILGFNECIEPITSNIYSRRTNAGDFIQANRYLMTDLINLDLWNEKTKNNIIANNGSIQQIDLIPQYIKDKYKTVWEIPMRHLIDMAADRGAFICQSQSLNLWLEDPNYAMLTSMHFYAWNKGLKTGIYYLRRRGKHQAQQFTIEPEKMINTQPVIDEEQDEICEMCSS
jgi:ribonucleotide reductase alpha subunit